MNVRLLPADSIFANVGWNSRAREEAHTTDDIAELIEDIRAHGLLHPLTVRTGVPTPNFEPHALVAGFRRFKALRHLGWEEIPCLVMANLSDEEAVMVNLLENLTHKSLDVLSETQAMERAFPMETNSQRDIAARLKRHQTWVADRQMLLRAPSIVQEMVKASEILITQIREWIKFTPEMAEALQQKRDKPQPEKPEKPKPPAALKRRLVGVSFVQ